MNGNYKQVPVFSSTTRFDKAPQSAAERSRMTEATSVLTAFNAGDIVPIKAIEVLPSEVYSVKFEDIIRQMTLKTPTMGEMICDVYAFFVPNRVVNHSWKNVQGENTSGSWTAPQISLAPLYAGTTAVQIPVGSVADYYGLPTQSPMPASVLNLMNDLLFRGYLEIYNQYFRNQNYQPPIPYSRENVYEGFLLQPGTFAGLDGSLDIDIQPGDGVVSDGSYASGAVMKFYGDGASDIDFQSPLNMPPRKSSWSALLKPLKANKFHDAMTSVLPAPQKAPAVTFSLAGNAPVSIPVQPFRISRNPNDNDGLDTHFRVRPAAGSSVSVSADPNGDIQNMYAGTGSNPLDSIGGFNNVLNGTADLSAVTGISVDDLRLGLAMQQLYELYGRSGTRYRELCHAMFGIDVDDPFSDIPRMLGHVRFPLELFQTAQTSSSDATSPQGNLAAFGYTNKGGFLFHETFLEHGFIHILCTVRQRNIYPAYIDPHWFRVNQLDFYTPILANISEQPVLLRTINAFGENPNATVFGYQEAWWEYRQHPDIVTGFLRSGVSGGLSSWTYQDEFDVDLTSADADFMESNAQTVLDNTLAVSSENAPQFKAYFRFYIDHEFPGPVYSVPGLDVV